MNKTYEELIQEAISKKEHYENQIQNILSRYPNVSASEKEILEISEGKGKTFNGRNKIIRDTELAFYAALRRNDGRPAEDVIKNASERLLSNKDLIMAVKILRGGITIRIIGNNLKDDADIVMLLTNKNIDN